MVKNVQITNKAKAVLTPDGPNSVYTLHELFFCNTEPSPAEIIKDYSQRFGPNSSGHLIHAHGDVSLSSDHSKFGGSSLFFSSETDYLTVNQSLDWNFRDKSLTIEFWLKIPDVSSGKVSILSSKTWEVYYDAVDGVVGSFTFASSGTKRKVKSTTQYDDNNWHHIAITREGPELRLLVDLVEKDKINTLTVIEKSNGVIYIGKDKENWNGGNIDALGKYGAYIDELRISSKDRYSKTTERYSSDIKFLGGIVYVLTPPANNADDLGVLKIQASEPYNSETPSSSSGIKISDRDLYITNIEDFYIRIRYYFDSQDKDSPEDFIIFDTGEITNTVTEKPRFQIFKKGNSSSLGCRIISESGGKIVSISSLLPGLINGWNDLVVSRDHLSILNSYPEHPNSKLAEVFLNGQSAPETIPFYFSGRLDFTKLFVASTSHGYIEKIKISKAPWKTSETWGCDQNTLFLILPKEELPYVSVSKCECNIYSTANTYSIPSAPFSQDGDTLLLLHFDESESLDSELVNIYLTPTGVSIPSDRNLIIKGLKISPGKTFTIGTERNRKDSSLYKKQKIVLHYGDSLLVEGKSGNRATLTILYGKGFRDGPLPPPPPPPTPIPTPTPECIGQSKDDTLTQSTLVLDYINNDKDYDGRGKLNASLNNRILSVSDARFIAVGDFILIDKNVSQGDIYIGESSRVELVNYCNNTITLSQGLLYDHATNSIVLRLNSAPLFSAVTCCMASSTGSLLKDCDQKTLKLWNLDYGRVYSDFPELNKYYKVKISSNSCLGSSNNQELAWVKVVSFDGIKNIDWSKINHPSLTSTETNFSEPLFETNRNYKLQDGNKCLEDSCSKCYEEMAWFSKCPSEISPSTTPTPTPVQSVRYYYACKKCTSGVNVIVKDSSNHFGGYPGDGVSINGIAFLTNGGCVSSCSGYGSSFDGNNYLTFTNATSLSSCNHQNCISEPTPEPTPTPGVTTKCLPCPTDNYKIIGNPIGGIVKSESFDGYTFINIPHCDGLNIENKDFSVEVRLKVEDLSQFVPGPYYRDLTKAGGIICKRKSYLDTNIGIPSLVVGSRGEILAFGYDRSLQPFMFFSTPPGVIKEKQWHDIALIRSSSWAHIYVDSKKEASYYVGASSIGSNTSDVTIGSTWQSGDDKNKYSGRFLGRIHRVRYSDIARSITPPNSTTVEPPLAPASGLIPIKIQVYINGALDKEFKTLINHLVYQNSDTLLSSKNFSYNVKAGDEVKIQMRHEDGKNYPNGTLASMQISSGQSIFKIEGLDGKPAGWGQPDHTRGYSCPPDSAAEAGFQLDPLKLAFDPYSVTSLGTHKIHLVQTRMGGNAPGVRTPSCGPFGDDPVVAPSTSSTSSVPTEWECDDNTLFYVKFPEKEPVSPSGCTELSSAYQAGTAFIIAKKGEKLFKSNDCIQIGDEETRITLTVSIPGAMCFLAPCPQEEPMMKYSIEPPLKESYKISQSVCSCKPGCGTSLPASLTLHKNCKTQSGEVLTQLKIVGTGCDDKEYSTELLGQDINEISFRWATDEEKAEVDSTSLVTCPRTMVPLLNGKPWWEHQVVIDLGIEYGKSFKCIKSVEQICNSGEVITTQTSYVCQNPLTLKATNIGPWLGNRPGYVCRDSPSFVNGTWAWYLTGATESAGRFNSGFVKSWKGALTELKLLKSSGGQETWEISVWGWAYCQGPTYKDVQTKAASDQFIDFKIGSGTLQIEFGCTAGAKSTSSSGTGSGTGSGGGSNYGVYYPGLGVYGVDFTD